MAFRHGCVETAGMTSKYDRPAVNLFDLAGMVQSITSQRRSGVMTARYGKESKEERTLRFVHGNLVALSGGPSSTFAKALVWSEVVSPEQLSACLATLGKTFRPEHLAQTVVARNIANKDGLLDAMDCYVEEGFSGLRVQQVHMRLGKEKRSWKTIPLPIDRGNVTTADVLAAPAGPERNAAIDAWCASVWEAYSKSTRALIVGILQQAHMPGC